MMRGRTQARIQGAKLATLLLLAVGCNDFSQHRIGGVRNTLSEGPPTPAAALAITTPPGSPKTNVETGLKPASFTPKQEPKGPPEGQALQHPMRMLYQRARQSYATMDSYMYRLKRREVVNGTKQPEELMLVKIRREPMSVYMKWLGKEGKGRELVYVQGKYDNKMQILLAAGDIPLPFTAGVKMPFAPDDPLVRAKSRHPITESGFGSVIERYGNLVEGIERGDPRVGTAKYLDRVKREEFEKKLDCVWQVLPPSADPGLPKGGQRWWFFDPEHGLPVLVFTHDPTGEIEYYCHNHLQTVRLDDDDFNPDRLWRK